MSETRIAEKIRATYPEAPAPSEEVRDRVRGALMAHIEAERERATVSANRSRRLRRRWLLAPAGGMAAVIVGALVLSGALQGGDRASAATVLRNAAAVAAEQPGAVPGPGQFAYVKLEEVLGDNSWRAGDGQDYPFLARGVRETWASPSGNEFKQISQSPEFLSEQGRQAWSDAGKPSVGAGSVGDMTNQLTPDEAQRQWQLYNGGLPRDPNALFTKLYDQSRSYGDRANGEMFLAVADALRQPGAPPALVSALYDVASRIPGVELLGNVTDSIGRPGIAVAMVTPHDGRLTLIFDPKTAVPLELRNTQYDGQPALSGVPDGTLMDEYTFLAQGVTDAIGVPPQSSAKGHR
jgi:hypothetical protein